MNLLSLLHAPDQAPWLIDLMLLLAAGAFVLWMTLLAAANRQREPDENALPDLIDPQQQAAAAPSWFEEAARQAALLSQSAPPPQAAECMATIERRISGGQSLLKAFIGLFVLLGLFGTVLGLSNAVASLPQTLQGMQTATDMKPVVRALSSTLSGLGTAFHVTLAGVLLTVVFSFLMGIYNYRLDHRLSAVHRWLNETVLPKLAARNHTDAADAARSLALAAAEVKQILEGFQNAMAGATGAFASSVDSLSKTVSTQVGNLAGAGDRLNAAALRGYDLLSRADVMKSLTDQSIRIADQLAASNASAEAATAKLDATMTNVVRAIVASERYYQQYVDKNNVFIAELDKKFAEWKTQQEQIARDLNAVLTGLTGATQDYLGSLSTTQRMLVDTAGLEAAVARTTENLQRWHQHLRDLDTAYRKLQDQSLAEGGRTAIARAQG